MITKLLNTEKWYCKSDICVRGYCFDGKNCLCENENFAALFGNVKNENDFCKILKNINGIFSVIVLFENRLFAASDKSRVFPLFYSLENENITISDYAYNLLKNDFTINSAAEAEILLSAFTLDEKTLADGIFQLLPSCFLTFENGKVAQKSYYSYCVKNEELNFCKNPNQEFSAVLDNVFSRLIKSVGGRQIVVPLSGGYDSRLIVAMLKKLDYQNVVCFTVGRENSPEHQIARQVAKKLDYNYHFIFTGNSQLIDNYTNSEIFQRYYKFSASLSGSFWMYEYFGVKYLIDNNLIDDNAVFIPGHSGDFLAGSQTTKSDVKLTDFQPELLKKLSKYTFALGKPKDKSLIFKVLQISDFDRCNLSTSIFDDVVLKTRLAKRINNSARLYEFFEHDVRLPFWDNEILEFFRRLPPVLKFNKTFYKNYLQHNLFNIFEINFSTELQPANSVIRFQLLKNQIKKFIPECLLRRIVSPPDYTCMKEICAPLIADLKQQNIPLRSNQFSEIFVRWYLLKIRNLNCKSDS